MRRMTPTRILASGVIMLCAMTFATAPARAAEAIDTNALAAKGQAIASQDPLAVELRNRQQEGPSRRGFDIGVAVAEGQTLPGPGKDRIRDSLPPEQRQGFNAAVAFSLERNRNADLAAVGAKIALRDPILAQARTDDLDVFYWLGFDIATGIFGDPALGAKGNTATGPGSLKIRDALSPAAQRGFNASVKLNLSRDYKTRPTVPSAHESSAPLSPSAVVISQVYGGGGTSGSTYANDFVELLNRGDVPIDLTGWSIQYASATGVIWQVTPLIGSIAPGQYFLISEGGSVGAGAALPQPDLTGRIAMAASAGKVALMNSTGALAGGCPSGPGLVDFVGYGGASCSEGVATIPDLGRAAAVRINAGCPDTDDNGVDFQVAPPQPRNAMTEAIGCAQ